MDFLRCHIWQPGTAQVEPGQQRCCQLETGLKDHVLLVLFGAGIWKTPQKTEEQSYFWLGAIRASQGWEYAESALGWSDMVLLPLCQCWFWMESKREDVVEKRPEWTLSSSINLTLWEGPPASSLWFSFTPFHKCCGILNLKRSLLH